MGGLFGGKASWWRQWWRGWRFRRRAGKKSVGLIIGLVVVAVLAMESFPSATGPNVEWWSRFRRHHIVTAGSRI